MFVVNVSSSNDDRFSVERTDRMETQWRCQARIRKGHVKYFHRSLLRKSKIQNCSKVLVKIRATINYEYCILL